MNILIIDAHPIFRAGLKKIIEKRGIEPTVHEARVLEDFIRQPAEPIDLDLVLADLPISEPQPTRRIKALVETFKDVPVVLISEVEYRQSALEAINLGAQGFMPKSAHQDEFTKCLHSVLDGSIYLSKLCLRNDPQPIKSVSLEPHELSQIEGYSALTNRQRETLALLANGGSNNDIGEVLGISDKTVRFHISAILRALKVRNRTEAALIASRGMGNTPIEAVARAS